MARKGSKSRTGSRKRRWRNNAQEKTWLDDCHFSCPVANACLHSRTSPAYYNLISFVGIIISLDPRSIKNPLKLTKTLLSVMENDWSESFTFHLSSSISLHRAILFRFALPLKESGWAGLSTKNSGAPHSGHLKLSSMSWQFGAAECIPPISSTNLGLHIGTITRTQKKHEKRKARYCDDTWWRVSSHLVPGP